MEITVDDDGSGLADDMREAVLQRGVRADEAAPGSGLGLAIVRDIAEVYGGSISLEASPLGGVRARLRFPRLNHTTHATIRECVSWKSRRLGVVPYAVASDMQRALVEERRAGRVPDLLLLLEHPHVITLGVKADAARSHLIATPDAARRTAGRGARDGPRRRHHLSRPRAARRLSRSWISGRIDATCTNTCATSRR